MYLANVTPSQVTQAWVVEVLTSVNIIKSTTEPLTLA